MEVHEITNDVDGMVLQPCLRHDSSLAHRNNPVATALIADLEGRTAKPRQVWGAVVWLGYADEDGVPASVSNDRVAARRELVRHALRPPLLWPAVELSTRELPRDP